MRSPILIFNLIILSICVLTGDTFAQTHAVDGKYITDWLVLGPFFPNDLNTDFLANVGGEANIQPKAGDKVATKDGKTLMTWKRYKSKVDIIDLIDAVGNYQTATAYAFCMLQSKVSDTAEILLGSDDDVAVWINGTRATIEYQAIDFKTLMANNNFHWEVVML